MLCNIIKFNWLRVSSSHFPELKDLKLCDGGAHLKVEPDDYQHAPFLLILDTKTISGIEEGEYKFDGNELHVIKKRLGNVKYFQTNLIGGQSFIFAKKSFLDFVEKYDIKGLEFKPVKVMSLTGESKDSRSVFWAIPEQKNAENIKVCDDNTKDKFNQRLPMTFNSKYKDELSQVDFFESSSFIGTCFSQRLYRSLHSENMADDIGGVGYCDIGLFSSEPTKNLKEKLIANNCFDFELEEKLGEL
jgi:hypothetical protein